MFAVSAAEVRSSVSAFVVPFTIFRVVTSLREILELYFIGTSPNIASLITNSSDPIYRSFDGFGSAF
jgi:hypothetical protein